MRLYISGKMSDLPEMGYPAFYEAEYILISHGYEVINPAHIGVVPNWKWEDYMRRALASMMKADGLALLDNWSDDSDGAELEVYNAKKLNMPVMPLRYWIDNEYKPKIK